MARVRMQAPSSVLIAQLARGMRRRIEQAIEPLGVSARELATLHHLRERGPAPQQALAELLGIDATNLVAVLNSLEDAELIERRRDRSDRRRAIIELSERGARLLEDLDRELHQIDEEMLAALTHAQRDALNALLATAVEHVAAACGAGCDRSADSPTRSTCPDV